jgi:ubiquinone/menaquinone biosynthesis C-methylase UbiE
MAEQPDGHRWFAGFWEWMVRHEPAAERRARERVAGGARGRVLEIGCGVGANFAHFGDAVSAVVATDPDPFMLSRAHARAEAAPRPVEVHQAPAEHVPFDDASFDTVVTTLTLCTVSDPPAALSELRRVLRPEGELRFYEHVRYDHAFGAFWQDAVTPVWRWIGAGCHPNRDLEAAILAAGFQFSDIRRLKPVPPIPPMAFARPHIIGVARPA